VWAIWVDAHFSGLADALVKMRKAIAVENPAPADLAVANAALIGVAF
jgi:hypothetical protein